MSMFLCLSVCLSVHSHNPKTARPNFTIFLCVLPVAVVRHSLTALRYVVYFRFYGWRHVFIPWGRTSLRLEEGLPGGSTNWTSDNYSVWLSS